MPKIKTLRFSLPKNHYFQIMVYNYMRSRGWLFLAGFVLACAAMFRGMSEGWLLLFFAVVYPLAMVGYLWVQAGSEDNKLFFIKRSYEIDDEKITVYLQDGTINQVRFEHVINVIKRAQYYLLYISQSQFIYLPFHAFENQGTEALEDILRRRNLID